MNKESVLQILRRHEVALRAAGVSRAALFGSTARDQNRKGSDIDIVVDLDPAIVTSVYDYAAVISKVSELFDEKVDVISREGLKPRLLPSVERDSIDAF